MWSLPRLAGSLFALTALIARAGYADGRSLVFLFGPTTEEHAHLAAHAAAAVVRGWYETPDAQVEMRYTANSDTQPFTGAMQMKDLEANFLYAADKDRTADEKALMNGFDRAGFTLSHHVGKRLMIAILDAPPLSADAQSRLAESLNFCKENSIAVIVVDLADPLKVSPDALTSLADASGGAVLRDAVALDPAVRKLFPPEKQAAAPETSRTEGPALHIRFVRIQSSKERATGTEFGPMHGYVVTEIPMNALQLQVSGGSYSGRVRVTETARGSNGKIAWQAKKEIAIKGPAARLEFRRKGALSFMRELQLKSGDYTIEGTVEDLIAEKTFNGSESLRAAPRTPGFDVSDAVLVRSLDESVDRFESDTAFAFDGNALVPLLNPQYGDGPFELDLYLVIYADLRGSAPDLTMEIVKGGEVFAKSHLAFGDKVRNDTTEGSNLDARGDQKNEFPYLARIPGMSLKPGTYEARVTARQNRITVTRSVPFEVR